MGRHGIRIILAIVASTTVHLGASSPPEQSTPKVEFEAASIKPSGADSRTAELRGKLIGGPGSNDPIQVRGAAVTLSSLIRTAYDISPDQLAGPGWMQEQTYDLAARVPKGATREQVKQMLQNLLVERFRLSFHREPRQFDVYVLRIAKDGSKLQPAAFPDAPPIRPGEVPFRAEVDSQGFPRLPAGKSGATSISAGRLIYWTFQSVPVSVLISNIQSSLGRETGTATWAPGRVRDETGLAGRYDYKLRYAGEGTIGDVFRPTDASDPSGGPDLFAAIETQLGLKLTKGKSALDVLVIDHAERLPVEN